MWILLRLAVALAAFVARFARRFFPAQASGKFLDGTPLFEKEQRAKDGTVTWSRVGIGFPVPVLFRLQPENDRDRWLHAIGVADEFSTGDRAFDRDVYIACDHPALLEHLRDNPKARAAILKILDNGYERIAADGHVLWLERRGRNPVPSRELALLRELRDALVEVGRDARTRRDPLALRIAFVEALIWSLVAYALVAYLQLRVDGADAHVDSDQLFVPGLAIAALGFLLLFGLVLLLLRRSSRAQRVVLEALALLLLALPVAGWQAASDLNRTLDDSEPQVEVREIERVAQVRRRRGPSHNRVVLVQASGPSPPLVPDVIDVDRDVYARVVPGARLEIRVGAGWLGVPWYREIRVLEPETPAPAH